ncbi:pectinesterase PPME1-like [Humulus lupulus]|uniref:pectinesterase PPME1-like n=1 Tax=Humulus lupulus TaxID=3486 RepID=UPI002B4149CB|nr:pectinesterase PPME1-like [Humulus lupulus]
MALPYVSKHIGIGLQVALVSLLAAVVLADDTVPVPDKKADLNKWFNENIKPFAERKSTLDPALVKAEEEAKIIKVRKDGSGEFKSIKEALATVPKINTKRIVIDIGPGEYKEKVEISADQNFISLIGSSPTDRPVITFSDTAKNRGTVDSATLIVLAQYFIGANLIIKNSAPRPDPYTNDGQALAVRINGDKGAFYNCKFLGFQDTLCDDRGNHLFKDCYIEGTVDFIFGRGTSLYLNADLFVYGEKGLTVITAQRRDKEAETTGFSFVHGIIRGTGKGTTFLGRPWGDMPRVIYSHTEMTSVVHPGGWTTKNPTDAGKLYYGEYMSTGEGASPVKREKFAKHLTAAEVKPFIVLGYIQASKWLLPPPKL